MEGTNVTLGDVEALIDIQSRQFQQSITDNLNRGLQAHMAIATHDLRNDNKVASIQQGLRRELQQETDQTIQTQEQFIQTHNNY